jgi:hypothetical protein
MAQSTLLKFVRLHLRFPTKRLENIRHYQNQLLLVAA